MNVAILDGCIFIDIFCLEIIPKAFEIGYEFHTSLDVFNGLNQNQKDAYYPYQTSGRLVLHTITESDRKGIKSLNYPAAISNSDMTVLFLANKFDAIILSGSKVIINYNLKKDLKCHGILWIFDTLIDRVLLSPDEAVHKLEKFSKINPHHCNYKELASGISKRIAHWKGI